MIPQPTACTTHTPTITVIRRRKWGWADMVETCLDHYFEHVSTYPDTPWHLWYTISTTPLTEPAPVVIVDNPLTDDERQG
jgi:hypothetical protein